MSHFRWNPLRYRTFRRSVLFPLEVLQRTTILEESGVSLSGVSRVVLVIEDEWLVREAVAEALRDAGWQVLETAAAEEAIALMRAGHHVDVVFTDIQLAGELSGWDVAEYFRAARPDVPTIYASGNTTDRSRQVNGSVFFHKPYEVTAVIEACLRLL